ncbi:hypothetical protein ES703_85838 [subsurface metagenome]
MTIQTFEEAKKETYSLFNDRCRGLLTEFLREKNKVVCPLCSDSCTEGEKITRALQMLIEELTIKAIEQCDNKVDIWLCLLSPYLTTERLLKFFPHKKIAKLLVSELESTTDRLSAILKERGK